MPMETNMPIGIRPINRPSAPSGTEGVSRRGDGGSSSAFSPRTDVAIKTAVEDMAGLLAKISNEQADNLEKMPKDLQNVVQNVMKQAFSMEETLSQGIGSTLESQRFSLEQLTALSRMLYQLGNLVEKGFSTDFGDDLQALLKNLKTYMTTEEGNSLEPVLLNKVAFELLDTKTLEDLPEVLQQLLAQAQVSGGSQVSNQGGESSSLGFLKQLVKYFMPQPTTNPEGGETAYHTAKQNANQPQGQQAGNANQPQGQQAGNANQPQGQQAGNANQPQGQQAGNANQPQGQQAGNANQPQGQQAGNANQPQGQQWSNANQPQGQQ
ncbi:MAG: hypothetical protein IKR28_01090, partial [Selenomonadaceae bacterium]|nr:hypothetical protein [Selenomonadaceae bacterium]